MPWHWGLLASYCLGFSSSLCERGTGIRGQCHPKGCLIIVSVKSFGLLGKQTVQGGVVCSFGKGWVLLPLQKQMPCATSRNLCTVLFRGVLMLAIKQENKKAFNVLLLFVIQVPKWGKKIHWFSEQYKWWKIIYFLILWKYFCQMKTVLLLPFQQESAVCR